MDVVIERACSMDVHKDNINAKPNITWSVINPGAVFSRAHSEMLLQNTTKVVANPVSVQLTYWDALLTKTKLFLYMGPTF